MPTQTEIGKKIGVSQRWVSYLLGNNESDTTNSVRTDTVEKVSEYFNIAPYRLFMAWPNVDALRDKKLDKVIECYNQVENEGQNNITKCAENETRYHSASKILRASGE